ncbi:Stk1 family PASTA domain-containing Ser/Thr kinase [Oscillibacter sp.]|uniref:Stk1 family PASTA domain-containing Ser/Thr kinase n=1 Tax=Oscillibacter sp. TaxID=1945593 RepID=UPI00262CFE0C|nr:Stk1 family PASTA domain-containing Ser/Thr kinase [Oscillibacter sp.]MDD3346320.1 Stk1 family PASTA domain-containing Ser/Thr kinase [Oscillibacter sp.]
MDQFIGKMLDNRYEILERIGTGGMAVVYKAKCHRLNRLVAVKILKADLAQDEDFRRRFNAESQAVAQLSHPNIVSVYDVSRGGDTEYIVMELIDGITLKQYMEKRGQLNWRESLHFMTQIMRGLSHAHSRGIIHRDIKPQNIMVLRDGSVKVADFGIACLENSAQTLTQEALGSVHYISPEQARGDRTDARSDIYSAGVVLYEMLSGRLPFEGDSAVSVAIQHLSSIPLAPREINPEIPEQLELICMKAMAPDLDRRYPSAEAMIADLEAFRKNPGVDLDFEMSDLRPEEADEPTQLLRTGTIHAGHAAQSANRAPVRDRRNDYEEDEPAPAGRKNKTLVITGVVVAAILLIVVLFKAIFSSFGAPAQDQYVVPEVLNKTVAEATAMPEVSDIFEIREMGTVFSDEVEEGDIAKQEPAAGEYRKGENTVIEVWVSAGEDVGEMIDVTNMTVPQAKARLKALIEQYNLTVEEPGEDAYVYNDKVTATFIISSEPAAGAALKKGDTIRLTVSKGTEVKELPVPQFVGLNIDNVLKQLDTLKLVCTSSDIELVYSDKPGGEIIWQSLAVNAMAKEGDTIKFQVSSGLSNVSVTEFYDLPQDERSVVHVQVYVGDETQPQYDETVRCSDGQVKVTLSGTGSKNVKVYFDGVLDQGQSHTLQFE